MSFMCLTRGEVAFDEREEVLVNPEHVTEVRVMTYRATKDFPDRTTLTLRVHGITAINVLAPDENGAPMEPSAAAQREPRELLRLFQQSARSAS